MMISVCAGTPINLRGLIRGGRSDPSYERSLHSGLGTRPFELR